MRRLIAISLALLMLAISLKVSVDFHYCSGKLAESKIILLFGKASCGMEETKNSCESHSSVSFNKASCCENQLQQLKIDDFQFAKTLVQKSLEFIPVLEQINSVPFVKGLQYTRFVSYRSPPDITSVFLPFTGVFLI